MSRTESQEQTTTTTVKVLCDFCDNSKTWVTRKACMNKCGKDVCHPCGTDDPLDAFSDHVGIYCPSCWALPGREAYFGYIDESDARREVLEEQWRAEA